MGLEDGSDPDSVELDGGSTDGTGVAFDEKVEIGESRSEVGAASSTRSGRSGVDTRSKRAVGRGRFGSPRP